jgi:glutathione S-transferase
MWSEWVKTSVLPALTYQVFWQLVRVPAAERSQAVIDEGAAKLKTLMPMADARIGAGPFLGGDHLCFADISLGTALYRYYTLDFERAATPNLDAYYARLQERKAYREHAMVSYESLKVPGA